MCAAKDVIDRLQRLEKFKADTIADMEKANGLIQETCRDLQNPIKPPTDSSTDESWSISPGNVGTQGLQESLCMMQSDLRLMPQRIEASERRLDMVVSHKPDAPDVNAEKKVPDTSDIARQAHFGEFSFEVAALKLQMTWCHGLHSRLEALKKQISTQAEYQSRSISEMDLDAHLVSWKVPADLWEYLAITPSESTLMLSDLLSRLLRRTTAYEQNISSLHDVNAKLLQLDQTFKQVYEDKCRKISTSFSDKGVPLSSSDSILSPRSHPAIKVDSDGFGKLKDDESASVMSLDSVERQEVQQMIQQVLNQMKTEYKHLKTVFQQEMYQNKTTL